MTRVVRASLIAVVIILGIFAGLYYYMRFAGITENVMKAVPEDVVMVFRVHNADSVAVKLLASPVVDAFKDFNAVSRFIDNAVKFNEFYKSNAAFKNLIENKDITISLHNVSEGKFDAMFYLNANEIENINFTISKLFQSVSSENTRNYDGVDIHDLVLDSNASFTYTFTQGMFIGSRTSFLVEDAIRQLHTGKSIERDEALHKVFTNKINSSFQILVNQNNIEPWLNNFLNANAQNYAALNISGWSVLNIGIGQNDFVFKGQSAASDSASISQVFRNQLPRNLNLISVLPASTAYVTAFSYSDKNAFLQRFTAYNQKDEVVSEKRSQVSANERALGVNYISTMENALGNEFALIITETSSATFENNAYALVQLADFRNSFANLNSVADKIAIKKNAKSALENYRGHKINFIDLPYAVSSVLGKRFNSITKFYFTDLRNNILIANQPSSLKTFIDEYEKTNLFEKMPSFLQMRSAINLQSNLLTLIQPSLCYYMAKPLMAEDVALALEDKRQIYNKAALMAMNYAVQGDAIQTSYYFNITNEVKSAVNVLWTVQVENPVIYGPAMIEDAGDSVKYLCVQDSAFLLYLIDNSGNVILRKQLDNKIEGNVHAIDYYKNGTYQFLLNTSSQICLFNKDSSDVTNYPIRLPSPASAGLSVFDYEKNHDYRIYVPCTNGQVYAYQASGKPVPNWNYKSTVSLNRPLQLFMKAGKEYLMFVDNGGTVKFTDRTGKQLFAVKNRLNLKEGSQVFDSGRSDSLELLVLWDAGMLMSILPNGETNQVNLDSAYISGFNYLNVDENDSSDFILMEGKSLKVFSSTVQLLTEYAFDENLSPWSAVALNGEGRKLVFVYEPVSTNVFAVNLKGKVYEGFPVKSLTIPIITDPNNDKVYKVITLSSETTITVWSFN